MNRFVISILILAFGSSGCERVRRVDVVLANTDELNIGRVPLGFNCTEGGNTPMITRAIRDGGVPDASAISLDFCLVVDLIRLGGQPSCRPSQMAQWCCGRPCRPILESRRYIPFSAERLTLGADFAAIFEASLSGEMITQDAPEEPVVVRVVGVANTACEAAAFDEDLAGDRHANDLVGCALSCPVLLSSVDTSVLLDTLSLSNQCNDTFVRVCASLHNKPDTAFGDVCEGLEN